MNTPWVEKYRPRTLDEVIGQEHIVERLKRYVDENSLPNIMFTGTAGVGKTTCALALAKTLLGDYWQQNFLELNASDARGIDTVRNEIKSFCKLKAVGAPFRIIFLDEVDNMTKDAQQALRREMEMYTKTSSFILSCNYSSKIIDPIQSRCAIFRFTPIKAAQIIRRLKYIAEQEGIEAEQSALENIVYFTQGDMRRSINILQASTTTDNKVTEEAVYDVISRAKPKDVRKIINKALDKDFMGARDLLRDVMIMEGVSGDDLITQFYQEVTQMTYEGIIPEESFVKIMEYMSECDYRIREGSNPRLQLEALLSKFLIVKQDA
ncbi:replication factor C small subunit [Methanosphaera sp. Vir-13MRS]|uniref:replication factor C small subunit n=1 Tax=Candidatus Methanosphaera massiliense TaxID=3017187 RepID=UPI00238046BD|nr:replication factor C small subunit [Candidatus Methanosphaera massiliense]MDD6286655.1 replication factor C small subunit [Methanobacteriaceae archaeon]MDE4078368.1 replication factor C small subunit [Candidatus Methanosphaera massiliense]